MRGRDDDAIGQRLLLPAIVRQDQPRNHGRGRIPRAHPASRIRRDDGLNPIARQHLNGGLLRRRRESMRILPQK